MSRETDASPPPAGTSISVVAPIAGTSTRQRPGRSAGRKTGAAGLHMNSRMSAMPNGGSASESRHRTGCGSVREVLTRSRTSPVVGIGRSVTFASPGIFAVPMEGGPSPLR